MNAVKARLAFATRRWGGSGALFAWDLWNEIHPGQAEESAEPFPAFIQELSDHLRRLERGIHGRAHPQTVSLFGPEMKWRPHLPFADTILRHPALDFANLHVYEEGTIDDPANTVDPAVAMGRLVAENIGDTPKGRPFFDSEHGPIHSFKDKQITLPEPFDDDYHRHVQWAHLAAGGAGGGMRWPNRHPHRLTPGMLAAQRAMTKFLPLIAWQRFDRRNVNAAVPAAILAAVSSTRRWSRALPLPAGIRPSPICCAATSSAPTAGWRAARRRCRWRSPFRSWRPAATAPHCSTPSAVPSSGGPRRSARANMARRCR